MPGAPLAQPSAPLTPPSAPLAQPSAPLAQPSAPRLWLRHVPLAAASAVLGAAFLYPLVLLVEKALQTPEGAFAGLENLRLFFASPALSAGLSNTLYMGAAVTVATVSAAFLIAYTVTHARAFGGKLLAPLSLLALFVPSVFPALGLIFLFGNQGLLSPLPFGTSLYGPLGVFLGGFVYGLPHAVLLLTATLRDVDPRLYQAARLLGAGPFRRFCTVTLPASRYGLISAAIVVFVLTITDFGVPKVLGGDYAMLATEIFKQVVGRQNFTMAAAVSLVLLAPSVLAFGLDAWARSKQRGGAGAAGSAGPIAAGRRFGLQDAVLSLAAWAVLVLPLSAIGMVVWGSFIGFWPYELTFTLQNYTFGESVYGFSPYWNSLRLALLAAAVGTALVFCAAYALERGRGGRPLKLFYRFTALLPLCVPGTVLGLAYIFAFNRPACEFFYGGIFFLAANTVIHFYTTAHLTVCGSLKRLSPQYEQAGASMGVPWRVTFGKVVLPLQKNTLVDVFFYLFVNALTTISAVVFLYSPDSIPASIAILQMFDTGQISEASAMGTLVLCTALGARLLLAAGQKISCRGLK